MNNWTMTAESNSSRILLRAAIKLLVIVAFAFLCTVPAFAQTRNAVVKHNTYLREGPSGTDKKIILLKVGDELELIELVRTRRTWRITRSAQIRNGK